jgi:hypothetical protein
MMNRRQEPRWIGPGYETDKEQKCEAGASRACTYLFHIQAGVRYRALPPGIGRRVASHNRSTSLSRNV